MRRLVRDLNIPIEVVGVPTVRESDGLALSSRNRRLNLKERAFAPRLYKALLGVQRSIAEGEQNVVVIKEHVQRVLHRVPDIKIDYFDLVDPETIRPVNAVEGPVRAALAVWIGQTRLIDNVLCVPPLLIETGKAVETTTM